MYITAEMVANAPQELALPFYSSFFFLSLDKLLLPVLMIFAALYIFRRFRARFFDYIVALAIAGIVSEGLKYLINSPRPTWSVMTFEGGGFSSTHTTFAFTVFFFLLICHVKKGAGGRSFLLKVNRGGVATLVITLIMALVVASIRLLIGAHYPVDVAAGIILALIVSILFVYYDISGRKIK